MSASRRSGTTDELGPDEPERDGPEGSDGGSDLLAALLDGMDAALCAFDADGVVTHWNREAERILGWTPAEAVGRHGLAGWAVRSADAEEVVRDLGTPSELVDITPMVDGYFGDAADVTPLRRGNFAARQRMAVLGQAATPAEQP